MLPDCMLLGASLGSNPIVMIALACGVLFIGGKYLAKGDGAVEERRRGAMTLAMDADKEGLPFLTPLLQDYAVGDYSGLVKEISKLREGLHDPDRRRAAMRLFLEKQFVKHAADAEGRKVLEEFVMKHIPDTDIMAFAAKVKEAKDKEKAHEPAAS